MTIRTFILSFILISGMTSQIDAQKFGHLNSGNLIVEMPETKKAEKELEKYQKELNDATDKLQADLDKRAQDLVQQVDKIAPVLAQEKYTALQKEQEGILKRRQEDQSKLLKKRDELMQPLLDRVQKAIDAVGKENGYTFIFDTSLYNAILYVEESDDITPLVKAKLGL